MQSKSGAQLFGPAWATLEGDLALTLHDAINVRPRDSTPDSYFLLQIERFHVAIYPSM